MCRRFTQLSRSEVASAAAEVSRALAMEAGEGEQLRLFYLEGLQSVRPFLSRPNPSQTQGFPEGAQRDAFPGNVTAVVLPTGAGAQLAVADMVWGFKNEWKPGLVYNARLETALSQRGSMWAESIAHRRCIVPVAGFFETHGSETVRNPLTGRRVKRQYLFSADSGKTLHLACIHEKGRFAVVTVEPDAVVGAVHDRMPLALDATGAALWLLGEYARAAESHRAGVSAKPDRIAGESDRLFDPTA